MVTRAVKHSNGPMLFPTGINKVIYHHCHLSGLNLCKKNPWLRDAPHDSASFVLGCLEKASVCCPGCWLLHGIVNYGNCPSKNWHKWQSYASVAIHLGTAWILWTVISWELTQHWIPCRAIRITQSEKGKLGCGITDAPKMYLWVGWKEADSEESNQFQWDLHVLR